MNIMNRWHIYQSNRIWTYWQVSKLCICIELEYFSYNKAVMLLALKIFFLLYFQPIDRPLPPNQQSRLLSFTTVERIWYQIQSRTRFILIPVYFKTLKMNVKMILLISYNFYNNLPTLNHAKCIIMYKNRSDINYY